MYKCYRQILIIKLFAIEIFRLRSRIKKLNQSKLLILECFAGRVKETIKKWRSKGFYQGKFLTWIKIRSVLKGWEYIIFKFDVSCFWSFWENTFQKLEKIFYLIGEVDVWSIFSKQQWKKFIKILNIFEITLSYSTCDLLEELNFK